MNNRTIQLIKNVLDTKEFDISLGKCPITNTHTDKLVVIREKWGELVSVDAEKHVKLKHLNKKSLQKRAVAYVNRLRKEEPTSQEIYQSCQLAYKEQHNQARRYLCDKVRGCFIAKLVDDGY